MLIIVCIVNELVKPYNLSTCRRMPATSISSDVQELQVDIGLG